MSIYLNGRNWIASPRYRSRGNDTGAIVKTPVKVKTDRFGVMIMRLEVQCRHELVAAYTPREGQLDPFMQLLVLDSGSLDITYGEHSWAIIACEFQGIARAGAGIARRNLFAQRSSSIVERQVVVRNAIELALTLTYHGLRFSYQYAVTQYPLAPVFKSRLQPLESNYELTDIRGPNDENLSGRATLAQLTEAGFLFEYATITPTFDRVEDGSGIWRVTEEHESVIIATMPVVP